MMELDVAVRNALHTIRKDQSSDGIVVALKTDAKNHDEATAIAEELIKLGCLDKGYKIEGKHYIKGQTHKVKAIELLQNEDKI